MKNNPMRRWVALPLAATVSWANVSAQTTGNSEDEEIFELSPFTVTSDGDDGYRATSTTAGSRLNSQLKDVAGSITVLTDAFMDDLGATDIATALSMVAGVETDLTTDNTQINLGQGFIGGDFNNVNASEGTIRVRGLGRATNAANYLEVFGPLDRFNMERTEFLRGANALLFGLGEPGGVVNYTTKKANLQKDINKVDVILDNFGTRRVQLDLGRVLIEDKLAVRFAGVTSDERYRVESAQQRNDSIYFAAAYKPFEGTRIDAYYENIAQSGRRPNYRLPQDNVSAWLAEYNRAYADAADDGMVTSPTRGEIPLEQYLNDNLVWDASWAITSTGEAERSPDILFTERVLTDANGDPLVRAGEFRSVMDVRATGLTAYFTPETGWETPYDGQFNSLGPIGPNGSDGRGGTNAGTVPYGRLRFHRSSFGNDGVDSTFVDPQVLDESIFPYLTAEIGAFPGNEREVRDQKWGANWEQKINKDFYLNFSYLKEDYSADQSFAPLSQGQAISIDINKYLPGSIPNAYEFNTGSAATTRQAGLTVEEAVVRAQAVVDSPTANAALKASNQNFIDAVANRVPNPNYLRPFFHGRMIGGYTQVESEAYLAQANYKLDFAEKTDRLGFLGVHNLTGFMSGNENSRHSYRYTSAAQSEPGVLFQLTSAGALAGQPTASSWYTPVFYIGDAVQPGDTTLNVTGLPTNTVPLENTPLSFYGFNERDPVTNSVVTRGSWADRGPLYWRRSTLNSSPELTAIDGGAWGASIQSSLWKNKIITTFGYRKDTVQNDRFIQWDNYRTVNNAVDPSDIDLVIQDRIARGLLPAGTSFPDLNVARDLSPTYIATGGDIEGDGSSREDFILYAPLVVNRTTVALKTSSIVFHATDWMRFFANESENFALTRPTTDGFGRANPPASGTTEEFGVGMSLFENKLDMKLTFYDTQQKDQLGAGNIRLSQRIPNFENSVLTILEREDQARANGNATNFDITDWVTIVGFDGATPITQAASPDSFREQQIDPVTNLPTVNPETGAPVYSYPVTVTGLSNSGVTQDSVSKGWEFEATYNPTRSIRISANVSKLENTLSNVERQSIEWVQLRAPYWQQFFDLGYHTNNHNDASVYVNRVVNADGSFTTLASGDAGYVDTSAPGYVLPYNHFNQDPEPDSTLLIADLYSKFGNELFQAIQNEGSSNPGISEYNARITANYTFREGRFKGVYLGTNLRWESGKAFGNPLVQRGPDEFPEGFPNPDLNGNGVIDANEPIILQTDRANPFISDSLVTGGLSIGYRGKLHGDKVSWRVQLNVDNVFKQGDDLRVIRLNGDQTPIYGINVPTTYKLTNSFDF